MGAACVTGDNALVLILPPPDDVPVVSLRESSIVSLAAARALDAEQIEAAWRFRRVWEAATVDRRFDGTGLDRVDRTPSAGRSRHAEAMDDLRRCRDVLGVHGYRLVVQVCGYGYHIRDLCKGRRDRDTATDMVKTYLRLLAELWAD